MSLSMSRAGRQTWHVFKRSYITLAGCGVLALAALGAVGAFDSSVADSSRTPPADSGASKSRELTTPRSITFYVVGSDEQAANVEIMLAELAEQWLISGLSLGEVYNQIVLARTETEREEANQMLYEATEAWTLGGADVHLVDMTRP